jgi:ATP-binding cassette subfamily C protein LapB
MASDSRSGEPEILKDGSGEATGDTAPARPEGTPRGGHLMSDLGAIAAEWHGTAPEADHSAPAVPTPEALVAAAGDMGIEVQYQHVALRALSPGQFPCVILEKDGGSRLLVRRLAGDRYECRTNGQAYEMDGRTLAERHAGVVFFVRPKAKPAPAGATPEEQPEAPAPTEPVRHVLGHVLKQQRSNFAHLLIAAAVGNLLTIALPLFSMAVYDRVIPHMAVETLWALSIGIVIALLLDLAVRYVRLKLQDAVALSAQMRLQTALYRHLLRIRMADAPRHSAGFASAARELDALSHTVPALAVSALVDLPFFLVMVGVLAAIGGPIAFLPVIGAVALGLVHLVGHATEGEDVTRTANLGRRHTGLMVETVDGLDTVKAAGASAGFLHRFERLTDDVGFSGHRVRVLTGFAAQASASVTQILIVAALVFGVVLIGNGAMTIGALTASTMLIARMMGPIIMTVSLGHRVWTIGKAIGPVKQACAAPVEPAGDPAAAARPIKGEVALQGVSLSYPGSGPVLQDVFLTIRPGERVALIGRIGSGKSSLLRLLVGLATPDKGGVLFDGHDIRQMPPARLRRAIGLMRQDPLLFDDTLQANIALGLPKVDAEAFERAVALAGVKDFAARRESGYAMPVGPRGERLSGGERQAVALARLLLAGPKVMLLDEPTASMDNTLEARVVRDLGPALAGRTLVIATHRLPLLDLVDRIVWLDNGQVIADGPKAEILKKLRGSAA